MKRFVSVFLLMSMIALSACGGSGDVDVTVVTSSDTTAGETTVQSEPSLLSTFTPELKAELGLDGYVFNVLLRDEAAGWSIYDLIAEEETGDILNDAVYARNLFLEDKYGFSIKAGYSENTECSELTTYILSGDTTYDASFPMARLGASAASQGLLYDMNDMKYINFAHSSWNHLFNDTLSIGGKQFYATGDITTNSYSAIHVFFFNKDIREKNKLDDPYELVKSGKWTIDALNKMAVQVAEDVNGDTVMDNNDRFGMTLSAYTGGLFFYYGAGEQMIIKDSDDLPVLRVGSERSVEVYDKITKILADRNTYYFSKDYLEYQKQFNDGNALFLPEVLDHANTMRPHDINFGILPLPKFDEEQEQYYCFANGWCISPVVVPKNSVNPDRTGFIIQALAEASQQFVNPQYYDKVLTYKALRDDESAEMLDLIIHNFILDNADIYRWNGIDEAVRDGMTNGDALTTIVAANKTPVEAAIEKTVKGILG